MKLELDNLAFEVTRRCNMGCSHYLRGESENVDIDCSYIDKALEDVVSVSCLTITGGEPSLNVPAIEHIVNVVKEKEIYIGSFFVATNGKHITTDFLVALLRLYSYVAECGGETEICSLALSTDIYHEDINGSNVSLMQGLSFFDTESKANGNYKYGVINEGRGRNFDADFKHELRHYDNDYECCEEENTLRVSEGMVHVCADGIVKNDCDTAYNDHRFDIGNIRSHRLSDILLNDYEIHLEKEAC